MRACVSVCACDDLVEKARNILICKCELGQEKSRTKEKECVRARKRERKRERAKRRKKIKSGKSSFKGC